MNEWIKDGSSADFAASFFLQRALYGPTFSRYVAKRHKTLPSTSVAAGGDAVQLKRPSRCRQGRSVLFLTAAEPRDICRKPEMLVQKVQRTVMLPSYGALHLIRRGLKRLQIFWCAAPFFRTDRPSPLPGGHQGLLSFSHPFVYDRNAFIRRFSPFRRPRESRPQFAHGGQVIHAHALKPVTINRKIRVVAERQILAISEEGCIFSFLLSQRWALQRTDCKDLAAKRGKSRSRCVKSAHRDVGHGLKSCSCPVVS